MSHRHHVIVVVGGAGGLELATRLGDRLGRKGQAAVTLVDRNETHVWKPLPCDRRRALDTLARFLKRGTEPRVKLH